MTRLSSGVRSGVPHGLISGQLDADRLDYLRRDSFFTGVTEGGIGTDRIIKMLRVIDDELVVEEKGIYSVEQFIVARRIMYWQVYFHKAVIASEIMLKKALKRAKEISAETELYSTPGLHYFIKNEEKIIKGKSEIPLTEFARMYHQDKVLSMLASKLIHRDLFKIEISSNPFDEVLIKKMKEAAAEKYKISEKEVEYLVFSDKIMNKAYSTELDSRINIFLKSGEIFDIAKASDLSNIKALSETVEKYFLCYPKDIYI